MSFSRTLMFMLAERRRDARHRIQREACASIEGVEVLILDANERGLALSSNAPVPVPTWMKVKLELIDGGKCVVTTVARVAWSDASGRCGVEFLDLSRESRGKLQVWLKSQDRAENERAVETVYEDATTADKRINTLLASAVERAVLLTSADGAAIALDDGGGLACRATAGEIIALVGSRIDSQSGLTGACLRSGRVTRCDSTDSDPLVNRESCRSMGISSIIAAPIVHAGCIIGLIEVFSRRSHAFDNSDCYALERLAETVADSAAMRASLDQHGTVCFNTTQTPEIALHAAEAGQAQSAASISAAPPSLSREAPATILGDASSQLAILRLPAGYEFSLTEKLNLHKRVLLWSVAAIVLGFGLWLSLGNPWRRRSNSPLATNPQFLGRAQTLTPSTPRGTSATVISMTRDSLEEVRQRAERGDANAQLQLGAAYASGKDNLQNYSEAVKWLTRSAEQGNVTAATSLGAFYWAVRGVTQGYVDAYVWSAIAEVEGDEASSYRVRILQSRLSPGELAEAKRRATTWFHLHSKQISLKHGAATYHELR